jgi:hypothetical protein
MLARGERGDARDLKAFDLLKHTCSRAQAITGRCLRCAPLHLFFLHIGQPGPTVLHFG